MKTLVALAAGIALCLGAAAPVSAQSSSHWPRTLATPIGAVRVYQPQIEGYTGNQFTAHAAVSLTPSGGTPTFGVVFFQATVSTDRDAGTVTVQSLTVTNSRFPNGAPGTADAVTQALTTAGGNGDLTFSQSQLLAQLALTQKEQAAASNLANTPPQIWFETQPSVLVTIDGEPKLIAAPGSSLMTVVNSPFFIALDPATKTYYLQGGGQWLSTANILQGPWNPAANVPDAVTSLAAQQASANAGASSPAPAAAPGPPPQVLVATQPTELIQTAGPAEYAPIDNTNLLYVTNTESTVLLDITTQATYVLLSGRWFSAPSSAGPWTYVAPAQLPADFARIPAGLPISNALASIPGTQAAKDAVLDAQVPQTAAIQRSAPAPKVAYDGDPKFQPVAKGAATSYAVNTAQSVVQVGDAYYLCSDGVWFVGDAALGPWVVADAVPPVIFTIPPSCPIYPVTYVRVYGATPDVVYCGYLPGYTGSYVYGGTVVYGTGWSYSPWVGSVFIPRPVTWGFGATFNFGAGWGFAVGGGWGVSSFGCGWNSGWWGVGNNRWNNWNFNNSWNQQVNVTRNVTNNITNNYNSNFNRTTNNLYRNHPERLTPAERQRLDARPDVARADDREAVRREPVAEAPRAGDDVRRAEPREPDEARRNDVFADRDGNVYRHDGDGWQQRERDDWHPAGGDSFSRNRDDLNRQFAARSRGNDGGDFHRGGGGGGGRRR